MLNVEARVKQLRLNHVFNIVQGLAPNYLQENFTLVSSELLVDMQQGQEVIEILLFPKYLHMKPEHFIIPL